MLCVCVYVCGPVRLRAPRLTVHCLGEGGGRIDRRGACLGAALLLLAPATIPRGGVRRAALQARDELELALDELIGRHLLLRTRSKQRDIEGYG